MGRLCLAHAGLGMGAGPREQGGLHKTPQLLRLGAKLWKALQIIKVGHVSQIIVEVTKPLHGSLYLLLRRAFQWNAELAALWIRDFISHHLRISAKIWWHAAQVFSLRLGSPSCHTTLHLIFCIMNMSSSVQIFNACRVALLPLSSST